MKTTTESRLQELSEVELPVRMNPAPPASPSVFAIIWRTAATKRHRNPACYVLPERGGPFRSRQRIPVSNCAGFYACSLEQSGFELPVPILEQPDDSRSSSR